MASVASLCHFREEFVCASACGTIADPMNAGILGALYRNHCRRDTLPNIHGYMYADMVVTKVATNYRLLDFCARIQRLPLPTHYWMHPLGLIGLHWRKSTPQFETAGMLFLASYCKLRRTCFWKADDLLSACYFLTGPSA